jgi:hypothetical protein
MLLLHATALSNFHSAQTPKLMICADPLCARRNYVSADLPDLKTTV